MKNVYKFVVCWKEKNRKKSKGEKITVGNKRKTLGEQRGYTNTV